MLHEKHRAQTYLLWTKHFFNLFLFSHNLLNFIRYSQYFKFKPRFSLANQYLTKSTAVRVGIESREHRTTYQGNDARSSEQRLLVGNNVISWWWKDTIINHANHSSELGNVNSSCVWRGIKYQITRKIWKDTPDYERYNNQPANPSVLCFTWHTVLHYCMPLTFVIKPPCTVACYCNVVL